MSSNVAPALPSWVNNRSKPHFQRLDFVFRIHWCLWRTINTKRYNKGTRSLAMQKVFYGTTALLKCSKTQLYLPDSISSSQSHPLGYGPILLHLFPKNPLDFETLVRRLVRRNKTKQRMHTMICVRIYTLINNHPVAIVNVSYH